MFYSLHQICFVTNKFVVLVAHLLHSLKTNLLFLQQICFVKKTNLLVQETNFTVLVGYLFLGNLFSIDLLNQKNKFVFYENKFVL